MSERANETKHLAYSAFWAILSEGKPPTVDLVMERLVAGGHARRNRNQIAEQLRTCWHEVGQKTVADRTIPGIPPETVDLVIALRDNLLTLCRKEFAEDVTRNQAELQQAIAAADARVTEAERKVSIERETVRMLEERLVAIQSELSTSQDSRIRLQDALNESRIAAETAQQRAIALNEERENLARQLVAAGDSHRQALQREEERYQSLQRTVMQQLDDERTRSAKLARQVESLETKLQNARDDMQAAVRNHSAEQAHLSAELGEARGRADALLQQVSDQKVLIDRQAQEHSDLVGRYQVLKEQCASQARELKAVKPKPAKKKG